MSFTPVLRHLILSLAVITALFGATAAKAEVVWYPLPREAYTFGKKYPEAQKLLFAFDYGHALVYERLLHLKGKGIPDPESFEREILAQIWEILKNPPAVKVEESDIAPNYVYHFPLIVNAFDWSHMLHQFVFDILATSEDRGEAMIARVNEIYRQYKANRAVAMSDVCKSMLFMDGHPFSKSFRKQFPSFNLLIWSYHWFQARLYEALMKPTEAERDRAVQATMDLFWETVSNLPESADFDMMPEVYKEAPTFYRAFPRISDSFDNNHMLHDIISDILASDRVSKKDLRSTGVKYGRMVMDDHAFRSSRCPAPTSSLSQ